MGRDFDFFGQTAKVSNAIIEEQVRFSRQQPFSRVPPAAPASSQYDVKPARTGYERYKEPDYVPDMQVDANLWGVAPRRPAAPVEAAAASTPPGGRKMMSLEEVEAAMRAKKSTPVQAPPQQPSPMQEYIQPHQQAHQQVQHHAQRPHQHQYQGQHLGPSHSEPQFARSAPSNQPVQILHRSQGPQNPAMTIPTNPSQPIQILQNPNRYTGDMRQQQPTPPGHQGHQSRLSGSHHVVTHPQQLANMSEEERAVFIAEDAKRAKRNHKIFLMSKDNGLMTPQDKNFITRIQLQQLVTATGNPNDHVTDAALSEDFYYQVHNQIRGGPRQHPGQPLSNFAQTYLFQTGGRYGGMRRQARGGDNHVQRMEQQVQRAVEAAKNKPKNKQLVIEGSLGKISFSNAKTPKPLLNIKRKDGDVTGSPARDRKVHDTDVGGINSRSVLKDIEDVYSTLMKMEDHDRNKPPPVQEEPNPELVGHHMDWQETAQFLNRQLWRQLKVHEPIGATATHPFIAFLSFRKGKKAIPRVFRHISQEQRTTILTMIVVHLDQLDVIKNAQLLSGETSLNAKIRENVELFSAAVMPSLFAYLSEAELDIVAGVLGLILTINLDVIARTRIGVSMLTMILSRAELIKQAGHAKDAEWDQW